MNDEIESSNDRVSRRDVLRRTAAGIAVAAAATSLGRFAMASKYGITGQAAPEISAESWIDSDGNPAGFEMSEISGKWTLLKCFQSWCPGCHSHGLPTLKKVTDAFSEHQGVALLGLQTVFEGFSTNSADKVRETQLRYELPIKMGHEAGDADGQHIPPTMRRYRTGGTPWMIVIDPKGTVVFNDFRLDAERFIDFLNEQLA